MQLQHLQTLLPPDERVNKVTAITFSPNNKKLAVVTLDRVVHLFDDNGERKGALTCVCVCARAGVGGSIVRFVHSLFGPPQTSSSRSPR